MEILGLIVGLCGLGVLAMRFGRDSRGTLRSEEQRLASLGMAWDGKPGAAWRSARVNGVVRVPSRDRMAAHPVRHRLAAGLYRLADWLDPGVSEPRRVPQRSS
jgi:hypothetical protein